MALRNFTNTSSTPSPFSTHSSTSVWTTPTLVVNTTNNATHPGPPCLSTVQDTEKEKMIKTAAYSAILLVSLMGNVLIAAVILSNKKMKRPTNYFILNMAMSDLIVPTMVISKTIAEIYLGPHGWLIDGDLGLVLCKLVPFLQDVSIAVSICSLILITVDRFFAVVFPMKHYIMSGNICKIAILMTWLIGMSLHAVYLYTYEIFKSRDGRLVCFPVWLKVGPADVIKSYYLTMFFLMAVAPFAIMATAYTIIIISLKRQSLPLGDTFTERQRSQRALTEQKILRMAIAIIVSFAVLWAPYNISAFLNLFVYSESPAPCWLSTLTYASFFLAFSNSAVNPCICFVFSENFRRGLKQMLARVGLLNNRNSLRQRNTQMSMTTQAKENKSFDAQHDSAL